MLKTFDAVMPMYNLIEYSKNYSKTSGTLWQYCRNKSAVNDIDVIFYFNGTNVTNSLNFKEKIIGQKDDNY